MKQTDIRSEQLAHVRLAGLISSPRKKKGIQDGAVASKSGHLQTRLFNSGCYMLFNRQV